MKPLPPGSAVRRRLGCGAALLVLLMALLVGPGRVAAAPCAGHHAATQGVVAGGFAPAAAAPELPDHHHPSAGPAAPPPADDGSQAAARAGGDHPGHNSLACLAKCCVASCQPWMAPEHAGIPPRMERRAAPTAVGGPGPAGLGRDVDVPPPRSLS